MGGTISLPLWLLFIGFIAGHRYGGGRASWGMAAAFGFANRLATSHRKETGPVRRETVSLDHAKAKPSVRDERIYYFCLRERRETLERTPAFALGSAGTNDPERANARRGERAQSDALSTVAPAQSSRPPYFGK